MKRTLTILAIIAALALATVCLFGQAFTDADLAWKIKLATPATGGGASTLNDGLIVYWKLDEASGTRADSEPTGTARNLTDSTTVPSATGLIGLGSDHEYDTPEYLSITDNADISMSDGASQSFTISAVVILESKPGFSGGIVSKNVNGPGGVAEYELYWDSGADRFYFSYGDGALDASAISANSFGAPTIGHTNRIIAWRDGSTGRSYIRVNHSTADEQTGTADMFDGTSDLRIGAHVFNAGFAFDGIIDEVAIWKRVLTSDEQTQLWNSGNWKT